MNDGIKRQKVQRSDCIVRCAGYLIQTLIS
nr:MAG TPA: hypothetical protein [Caudoviricetes sp.]DAS52187.1 MAG TPA: hypothetical protein [Caudoviricetes sp.]DAS61523.1 MAG TPA: hypothetical protein [Caudoviricetes sp.]